MADRPARTALQPLPIRPNGRVDVDAVAGVLRRRGRVHRFESAAEVPGGTGRDVLVPATGRIDRVTAATFARLDQVLGPPGSGEPGGHPAGGHVVAIPYDLGTRPGATAFVEAVDVAVVVEADRAWAFGSPAATRAIREELGRSPVVARRVTEVPRDHGADRPAPRVTESLGRERFGSAAERVLERIADGDAYVVNLTQQLTTTFPGDVHELYQRLRAVSPAPHGAVIELGPGVGLASVSPEAFLRADDRRVTVRPIKGTRPRREAAAEDRAEAESLRTSEKERAENVMVVDLERNDLGRVCEVGSVTVPELLAVEAHPTVWQLVSTVRGRLREDVGYASALMACFPCGSVTGAPKHRVMRIIEELEPVPRGWYCGAVGWVAPGTMRTAVTIRTAVLRPDGTVSYGTGSGIVADSDPAAEYAEARLKAGAFLAAAGATWVDDGPVVDDGRGGVGSDMP